jgi:DNA-binding NarL/FixJ family response regulator
MAISGTPLFGLGLKAAFDGHPEFTFVTVAENAADLDPTTMETTPGAVLVDAELSDPDGLSTAAALRQAYPLLGVVLLGRASDELLFRSLSAGLSAFVPISAPTGTLRAVVRHAAITPASFSAPDLAKAMARRESQRYQLSPREKQVLNLLRDGLTMARIAEVLMVTESTAKTYVSRIYDKLGVRTRSQALAAVDGL